MIDESDLEEIVLASGSPVRRALLVSAGVPFAMIPSEFDEAAYKAERPDAVAAEIAQGLAEEKALAVSAEHKGLVIGADQVLSTGDRIWDKAESIPQAAERLRLLRGGQHELICGCALARDGRIIWRHIERSRVVMRNFSDEFLEYYLDTVGDSILASVGCYQFEGPGAQLIARVDGDYFAILGLPLLPLFFALRAHGGLPE